ncbi:hypothetical protein [Robinsoniella peoriensis]|nr:hypothetical protein [Robinsoniella peoriensis]
MKCREAQITICHPKMTSCRSSIDFTIWKWDNPFIHKAWSVKA